jgi:hypothetical protein
MPWTATMKITDPIDLFRRIWRGKVRFEIGYGAVAIYGVPLPYLTISIKVVPLNEP